MQMTMFMPGGLAALVGGHITVVLPTLGALSSLSYKVVISAGDYQSTNSFSLKTDERWES